MDKYNQTKAKDKSSFFIKAFLNVIGEVCAAPYVWALSQTWEVTCQHWSLFSLLFVCNILDNFDQAVYSRI